MKKSRLIIDINPEDSTITITDEEGTQVKLESLALFGGDAVNNVVFIKMVGASADAAWAYGQGYKLAHETGGGPALRSFYRQCAAHVCQIIDPDAFKQYALEDEIVNKWECKDQSKWGGWDSEDVLEDKQKSEKKRWN
jgi:hypothetical protein